MCLLREYFTIFILAVRGNRGNVITVQFTSLSDKSNSADNEKEGREKLDTLSDGLKVVQDGRAGRVPVYQLNFRDL